jgi:hypothetical protein
MLAALALAMLAGCGGGAQSSTRIITPVESPSAALSPASYTFGNQLLNSTSAAGSVTLSNTGTASLSLTGIAVTGDFAESNNCGTSLSAGSSCAISVTFTPTATGSRSGSLTFTDNAASTTQSVQLYGTGVTGGSLAMTPASIAFGEVVVGQSGSQPLTITNNGGESVTISSALVNGGELQLSGISLPLSLAPSQSTTFDVTFSPTATGSISDSVQLANNSTTSQINVPVTGTGVAAPNHSVTLRWADSSSSVVGYNAYRSTVSGGPYTKLPGSPTTETSFEDLNVQAGDTYYYVVTALASNGSESGYSAQVSATIPTP